MNEREREERERERVRHTDTQRQRDRESPQQRFVDARACPDRCKFRMFMKRSLFTHAALIKYLISICRATRGLNILNALGKNDKTAGLLRQKAICAVG